MKQVKSAVEAWGLVEEAANNEAINSTRVVHKMDVGQGVRQGDIYIFRVEPSHPHGAPSKSRQLAKGSTQGSRHVAEGQVKVYEGTKAPRWASEGTFTGPFIESGERFTISHPEHAHVELPPGCYQVTHQMDARTLERVQD